MLSFVCLTKTLQPTMARLVEGDLMPAVYVLYPKNLFAPADKAKFRTAVKNAVAKHMDAVDPAKKQMTHFGDDPDASIDLILMPYNPDDVELTTTFVATIVTYEWPDRMRNIGDRVEAIAGEVRDSLPPYALPEPDCEVISFTFLGKQQGAWFAV